MLQISYLIPFKEASVRVKVILNPWSDRGRAIKYRDLILAWAEPYGGVDLTVTERPGHATLLATAAADAGYDLVVAAGGDGTIHEVVNGLVHGGRAQTTLGVIPIGSGNDFAYALKLNCDPQTAVQRLFEGQRRLIDLARIEDDKGRFAIVHNGVGYGFDATITIESRNITRIHGFAMYLVAVLRTIAFYYQTPRCEILFDNELVNQQLLMVSIGVGPRAGGGFLLTPDAHHNAKMLHSCTVSPVGRMTMLAMLPKVMKGTHTNASFVTMRRSQYIDIKSDLPMPVHTDGEVFAYPQNQVYRITLTSLPDAITVMV
jgi:diacylglycerol kinase (ATP)